MKRLLISTTALSMALMQINPAALMAQTMTEDGSIIADDGSVLCLGTAEQPCDLDKVMRQLKKQDKAAAEAEDEAAKAQRKADKAAEQEAQRQADEAAAAAAAEEQRQADEAAAAEEQRQADEAAAAAAAADADKAAAAAEEQRQADEAAAAEAQRQADEAAAAAEADKAAAAAEEQRQADEAAAAAAAEEQRQADEAAAAEADKAAAAAEEQRQADEAAAADEADKAQRQADKAAAAAEEQRQADEAAAADEADKAQRQADKAAADEEQRLADEAAAAEKAQRQADKAAQDQQLADPAEEPAEGLVEAPATDTATTEPVDAPAPTEQAVEQLTTLLAAPDTVEPAALDAAALLAAPKPAKKGDKVEIPEAKDAEAVQVQTVTAANTRSSSEEFKAAPKRVKNGKGGAAADQRDGMTDLEKVGLVALGALVVGAIINNANSNTRDEVVSNTGDRVVVRRGTQYVVYKDDDALLRQPGSTVRTETFRDGSTRTIVERADGTQIVTIRDVTGRVLRRATYDSLGREIVLIDDLAPERAIDVTTLPTPRARVISMSTSEDDALLKARMAALDAQAIGRSFSLRQIREIKEVRNLAATVDVNNITFDTGSSAISPTQAESLASLGRFLAQMVRDNPNEVFLIEGHTDAVGSAASNLALSDRRAESVALAMTEYFDVPPENMVVQGYGESDLRVATEGDERQNRRVAVRIITPLLGTASASLQ